VWGLSVLGWHTHAIDEHANHPTGVYVATTRQPREPSAGDPPTGGWAVTLDYNAHRLLPEDDHCWKISPRTPCDTRRSLATAPTTSPGTS
jgi:hypothetical protein